MRVTAQHEYADSNINQVQHKHWQHKDQAKPLFEQLPSCLAVSLSAYCFVEWVKTRAYIFLYLTPCISCTQTLGSLKWVATIRQVNAWATIFNMRCSYPRFTFLTLWIVSHGHIHQFISTESNLASKNLHRHRISFAVKALALRFQPTLWSSQVSFQTTWNLLSLWPMK